MTEYNFDDIRPFADSEVPEALTALLADPEFLKFRSKLFPKMSDEEFAVPPISLSQCIPNGNVGYEIVSQVAAQSAFSLDISGRSRLGKDLPFTYISNHQDIILDAAFLNVCLRNIDRSMCQIAIGDNLLKRPWTELLLSCLVVLL